MPNVTGNRREGKIRAKMTTDGKIERAEHNISMRSTEIRGNMNYVGKGIIGQ